MSATIDIYQRTWFNAIKFTVKVFVLFLGAPYLFFSFLAFLLVTLDDSPSYRAYTGDLLACIFSLVGLLCIMLVTAYVFRFNKRNYNALREAFILEGRFAPQMELCPVGYGGYLGLDTQNGTLVYFCNINNRQKLLSRDMLVVGFTNTSWRQCELRGQKLTIYTNDPMLPYVNIQHRRAPVLYERICAMQRLDFSYDVNFPGWIDFQAKQVAEELNLNLITVKS